MAFDPEIKQRIDDYVWRDIPDEASHLAYFDFINDGNLARRLGEEFVSVRYIYKLLEGLGADDWLLRAQIRLQFLSYASIYEASLHHILFSDLRSDPRVAALTEFRTKKEISIPTSSMEALAKHLEHDGRQIIPTYEAMSKTDETKVRFDRKADCACNIGIIEEWLKDELIEIYEVRNSIHIHAEIRKGLEYELELSKRAYWRIQPFKDQIVKWQHSPRNPNRQTEAKLSQE